MKRLWCWVRGHDVGFERGAPLIVTQLAAFFPHEEGTFLVCRRCGRKVRRGD